MLGESGFRGLYAYLLRVGGHRPYLFNVVKRVEITTWKQDAQNLIIPCWVASDHIIPKRIFAQVFHYLFSFPTRLISLLIVLCEGLAFLHGHNLLLQKSAEFNPTYFFSGLSTPLISSMEMNQNYVLHPQMWRQY